MLRKLALYLVLLITIVSTAYFSFVYYASYSDGVRSGELIKISSKGILFKTWEGEISQGISGAQIFSFSVLDKDEKVVQALKDYQGQYVKVSYIERYRTFPWWGDTKYFVTDVQKENAPRIR
jgi:hypothetical protein